MFTNIIISNAILKRHKIQVTSLNEIFVPFTLNDSPRVKLKSTKNKMKENKINSSQKLNFPKYYNGCGLSSFESKRDLINTEQIPKKRPVDIKLKNC
jgi:hypothetical protein